MASAYTRSAEGGVLNMQLFLCCRALEQAAVRPRVAVLLPLNFFIGGAAGLCGFFNLYVCLLMHVSTNREGAAYYLPTPHQDKSPRQV